MARASSAMCANACVVVLAVFAAVTPYWIWAYSASWNWNYSSSINVGSGPFVVSSSSQKVSTPYVWGWNSFYLYPGEITSAACSSTVQSYLSNGPTSSGGYATFGQYGFCTGLNGSFQTPKELKVIQAFTILTALFAGLSLLLAAAVPKKGSRAAMPAAALSALGCISAVVAFAQATSFKYYKDLRNGSAGLLMPVTGLSGSSYVTFNYPQGLYYGPAYWSMVVSSLMLLVATFSLVRVGKQAKLELEAVEFQGQGQQQQHVVKGDLAYPAGQQQPIYVVQQHQQQQQYPPQTYVATQV